jgi:hypothetical protein
MAIAPVKVILAAHSGFGKTGASASLAGMGLGLRVLDVDNGSDVLFNLLTQADSPYVIANAKVGERLESIVKLAERRKSTGGKLGIVRAEVWSKASALIEKWVDPSTGKDFGSITEWTTDHVLIVGSFTRLAESALRYIQGLNGRLNQHPYQSDYGDAQQLLRSFLEIITSPDVGCNVVLECHIEGVEQSDGTFQDFPRAVGKALAPVIGTYFNTLLEIKKIGQGSAMKRVIRTVPTGSLGVKNTAPHKVPAEYELSDGLAQYFQAVRGA